MIKLCSKDGIFPPPTLPPTFGSLAYTRIHEIEQAVQRVEEIKPRVLLLDLSLAGKKPKALLERILLLSPATLRVLLVDDVQDIKWQPQFAEATLVKGVSPSAFATILTDLLLPKGIENEQIQSQE